MKVVVSLPKWKGTCHSTPHVVQTVTKPYDPQNEDIHIIRDPIPRDRSVRGKVIGS